MVNQYNQPDLLVITSYPKKGSTHGAGTVGVASYAKNTLLALEKSAKKRKHAIRIRVIAEKLEEESESFYKDHTIDVDRVWERNNPFWFIQIIRSVAPFYLTKQILIELELAMFGSPLQLILFPILLILLRFMGKHISIVLHQTVDDPETIAMQFNVRNTKITASVFSLLTSLFYRILGICSHHVIVFDTALKTILSRHIAPDKISIIAHGVEGSRILSKRSAREALELNQRELIIVCFGFLAWYKGSDWIVHVFSKLPKKILSKPIRLIIAGGPNPNHIHNIAYQKYIRSIQKTVEKQSKRVVLTGFVPEDRIRQYFAAGDIILFPYRTLFSASGPLSIALSLGKPFLLSSSLLPITETYDMAELLVKNNVTPSDICFSLSALSLKNALRHLVSHTKLTQKISKFSTSLGMARNFRYIGNAYYTELFIRPHTAKTTLLWNHEPINTAIRL